MKAIRILQHGAVSELQVSQVPKPEIRQGEVLVKVEASGINPSDVGSVLGRFPGAPLPRIVGRDFAGIVVDGPPELIGMEVWGSGGDLGISRDGTHAQYVALPIQAVSRRPKNLTAEEAGAAGVPFVTAFSALFTLGQLKKGELVIVSGAAGSVGQTAIQLAKARGSRVAALVRDASESRVVEDNSVDAIASSEENNLETRIHEITGGAGADLALNGVGANILQPLFAALRTGGRQVIYSVAGGREFTLDLLSLYRRQLALIGLNTGRLDAAACAAILNEIAPLFESGALKPPAIEKRYPISDVAKAYERVAAGGSGKIVLDMNA